MACDVALHVAAAASRRIREHQTLASAAKLRRRAAAVRDLLTGFDLATGKPLG